MTFPDDDDDLCVNVQHSVAQSFMSLLNACSWVRHIPVVTLPILFV